MSQFPDEQVLQDQLAALATTHPSFPYPWNDLESFLHEAQMDALPLVGYGSLINQASAGRTINTDESAKRQAVAAYGAIRVFNYRMPERFLHERYGSTEENKVAALNCEATGNASDAFNGILSHVARQHLPALREREKHYSLKPCLYTPWDAPSDSAEVAYFFELLPNAAIPDHPYDPTVLPHSDYTDICRTGAAAISPDFLNFFDHTTLLADKQTTLASYLGLPNAQ
ncbi:MAG: hypothetical protein AAGB46_14915 [Verrucomicrobiota bacterium]